LDTQLLRVAVVVAVPLHPVQHLPDAAVVVRVLCDTQLRLLALVV
jgi:hypothetical protein